MFAKRIPRDEMLRRMHDDLHGTSDAKVKRGEGLSVANGFTEYRILGKAGIWHDPIDMDRASFGTALPKRLAK